MRNHVVVVGDLMADIIVKPNGLAAPGSDQPATITPLPGGSAANQAAWLAAFSVPVSLIARVGADDHDRHSELLRRATLRPSWPRTGNVPPERWWPSWPRTASGRSSPIAAPTTA